MVLTYFTAYLQITETWIYSVQGVRHRQHRVVFNAGEVASGMCLTMRGDCLLLVGAKNTVGFVIS